MHSKTQHKRVGITHPLGSIASIYSIIILHNAYTVLCLCSQYINSLGKILEHSCVYILLAIERYVHCCIGCMRVRNRTERLKSLVPCRNLQHLCKSEHLRSIVVLRCLLQLLPCIERISVCTLVCCSNPTVLEEV